MEEKLAELNKVVGVRGCFVCGGEGQILAQAFPDGIQSGQITRAAAVVSQTFQALSMSGNRVSEMDLVFGQGRLIIKALRGGVLVLLCDRTINVPLVNLNAAAVAKKLSAELKPGKRPPATNLRSPPVGELPVAPRALSPDPLPPSEHHEQSPIALEDGPLARRLKRLGEMPNGEAPALSSTITELRPPAEMPSGQEGAITPDEEEGGADGYSEPRESLEAEAETSSGTARIRPELVEPDREARGLIQAAAESSLTLRALGTLAVHWHCRQPPSWLRVPAHYRTLEFCGLEREASGLEKCFSGLGYQPAQGFNTLFAKHRLTFDAQGWRYQIQVYLDAFGTNPHLDVSRYLEEEPLSLSPTLLFLERLQTSEVTEDVLRELSALGLDHELHEEGSAPETINLSFIRNLCVDDWAWYTIAQASLAKLRNESATWLAPAETARLEAWVDRLWSSIENAPKSLRWQMHAIRGRLKPHR